MTEKTSEFEKISNLACKQDYLIFDPKLNIGDLVKGSLAEIGVSSDKIHIEKNEKDFVTTLKKVTPSYIICYTDPLDKEVFSFIDEHKKIIPDSFARNFAIFSDSKSIFTLAQALEEEIDSYFVPPYTKEKITSKILQGIKSKRFPSEYKVVLSDVSNKIKEQDYTKAKSMASLALSLHPRPSMAYFHLAKIEMNQGNLDEAISLTISGLKFNKEHYKCLMMLHDLYYRKGNFDSSYRVLKKIFEIFPLSMIRIFDFFKLSIRNGDFAQLKSYCRDILGRNDENILLVRFCTSGLAICALNELNSDNEVSGTEILTEALKYSQNDPKILRNLYKVFMNFGLQVKSEEVFAKFKNEDKSTLEWEVCKYLREIHSSKPVDMIIPECSQRFELIQFDEDCITHLSARSEKEASSEMRSLLNETLERFNI
jgi:tetratricopeptide (TPR) repeat protein